MSKLVTIFGGSGFVGRYIARALAQQGWRVRVAVRRPNEALFVKPYGAVGQVEPVLCNIRNEASVAAALRGAHAVVNCVGTFETMGANNQNALHVEGAARIARLAAEAGVESLVHLSAIGADPEAASAYARSKGEGEVAILASFPKALILRPSVIFGPEDGFFNRFGAQSRMGPILPLVGAETKFQPVYVEDVAAAAANGIAQGAFGVYELGGPEAKTLRAIIGDLLAEVKRRRIVVNLPFFVGSMIGGALSLVQAVTLGLIKNTLITPDHVRLLKVDSVVSPGAKGLTDLGVTATPYESVFGDYLWRYRPAGQFTAIRDSAKNLKKA
jgi:uncharacterized protein YbjT (DUF2867 family)